MKTGVSAIVLLFVCATVASARPNVVFIFADDLGWGDLGCYGHPRLKTPYLDNVANRYPDEVERFSKMLREFKASIPQGVPQAGSGSNAYPMPGAND